jgi:ketosteroid isomerase-like protein
MKKYLILLTVLYCSTIYAQTDMPKEIEALKQAEIDFSNYSKQTDMRQAFLAYVAPDGVLLRPYSMPIVGFEAIKKELGDEPVEFTLTWVPLFADVSSSGDLGYTYGTFELTAKDEKGAETVRKGTYATVWKKDKDGKWKWVLDTGNPGLEPKKE